jgi:hypothetical protein
MSKLRPTHAEIAANARAPYARRILELEARITQLREREATVRSALIELVTRCDGDAGVRADGSNIDTLAAHAALGDLEPDAGNVILRPVHCPQCGAERGVPIPAECPHNCLGEDLGESDADNYGGEGAP